MRVTFLAPCYPSRPIGGLRVMYEYANRLVDRGHDVTVLHAALMEPWQYRRPIASKREGKVVARGVLDLVHRAPTVDWHEVDPRVRLAFAPTLAAKHAPDADVVVATSWRTAESLGRYPRVKGAPYYLIQHYETWDAPASRVDATWRMPFRKVVIAEWLEAEAARLGCAAEDVRRIPNGIDLGRFHVSRPIERRPHRVAMLWSGAPIKGGAQGIAALEGARRDVPDLSAVLFGVAARPSSLPAWIDYVQDPSQAVLVDDVYNGSAIYLCPSRGEGWHLPPAEAMACGAAVVSTDIGGVRDYAHDGDTALLAPVDDVGALAARIVTLCRDEELRAALARAGQARIATFTWGLAVDAFESYLLESMVTA